MYAVILFGLLAFVPENLQTWYSSCSRGDWKAAVEQARIVYETDSTCSDALAALVVASALQENFEISESEGSRFSKPLSSLSRAAIGVILMSGGDTFPGDAENQLLKSIRLEPDNVLSWYLMGILNEENDNADSALVCFREVERLDPSFLPARLEAARIYRDSNNTDEALDGFRSIMTVDSPSGILALAEYILLMEKTGETTDLDRLENVLVLADSSAWTELAEQQIGRHPEISRVAIEKAEAVFDSALFSTAMAKVFLELKEYHRAISISKCLLESSSPDSEEVLEILGIAYFESNEINRAEEIFLTLLNNNPSSVSALLYLGDIAEQNMRTADAVDCYLSVLEINTSSVEARNRLKVIAGDSYNPESVAGSSIGFSMSTAADFSVDRGNRALLEWGGNARISYRFDRRGTSVDANFGGRSVTWEEVRGLRNDTLNTGRGWAGLALDYWFSDSYFFEVASNWDRQMYTERPWQLSSYCATGYQKWFMSSVWFLPELGIGLVNTRWNSGTGVVYSNDFSLFAAADLWYRKPHTFIREAKISGSVFFPPDNPDNFISSGSISLAFRTWSPLYVSIGYSVDYTRTPEFSTWRKFNTSFTTSINFDLL